MEPKSFVIRKEQAGIHYLKQQLVKSGQYITLRLLDYQLNSLQNKATDEGILATSRIVFLP